MQATNASNITYMNHWTYTAVPHEKATVLEHHKLQLILLHKQYSKLNTAFHLGTKNPFDIVNVYWQNKKTSAHQWL
jgi:hypothetical protein